MSAFDPLPLGIAELKTELQKIVIILFVDTSWDTISFTIIKDVQVTDEGRRD